MKKLVSLTLFLVMICSLAPGGAMAQENTFEGPGFNSAEDATLAYIEAYNRGDLKGMLSTFAIESYVDNYDCAASLKIYKSFSLRSEFVTPSANEYKRRLEIVKRYYKLAKTLLQQYLLYNSPEDKSIEWIAGPAPIHSDEDIEQFIYSMSDVPMTDWFGTIELKRFMGLSELSSSFDERYKSYCESRRKVLGADEYKGIAASVSIDGNDALQCMACVRYGDRWYNLSPCDGVAGILGMNTWAGGLGIYDEYDAIIRKRD